MAIRVGLHHVTRYIYDRPVTLSPHVVRLRPAPHCRTTIAAYSLKVTPEPHFVNWQQDPFGNYLARFVFLEPASEVRVEVDLVADLVTINPFDFFLEEWAEKYPFEYREKKELEPYLPVTRVGARFDSLIAKIRQEFAKKGRRMVDVLVDVNQLIQSSLRYDIRMEPGVFAPDETLERGHGSCRDFAWLMVNVLRALGLAARFVSGYSIQLRPDQKPLEGPIGVLEDCTDLHAWAEAYLPGAGWIGLDATSGLWCGEGHLPLACTAEPSNAAAISGSYAWDKKDDDDEIKEDFSVEMKVTRLEDRPRPTRSYTEEQWQKILQAGDDVERVLQENDVRLTMGGEPTFVSADDMESAEWSTAALGPTKARLADELLRRLRARYAPGSVLHHGQGKWYPGEQLPRWAYGCYWRSDGVPVWQNVALLADGRSQGHGPDEAATFIRALVNRLGVGERSILPAYEDVWYFLWRERRLPANVDPFDSKLEDEQERARLRRVFSQGLSRVVGWALPLRCEDGTWQSGAWHLRDQRLYLLPGDSAMGLRLPLDSLPWSAPEDLLEDMERDPFAPRPPLPRTLGQTRRGTEAVPNVTRGSSARDLVRTALCVEPRDGVLHVFLPPVYYLEHYLDLVAHIEGTADQLKMPVRLEGYAPPRDPRLQQFSVTPDPGVIEVNIHPARSWRETVERTSTLYEEARLTRLGTDKFMVDGRHTGTGGGNHVVLGGPTPDDSPLLRRPDLLRSFSAYFNNHPALSYLFSSQFVGPTSQAPRVDEARQDTLYDLEVAYSALSGNQPWLGDRLFRHLFVDVTGNTHRTAMCIDKLFSPDHAAGRQGLLELRSFEMPPDARMSLAQQLLIRALVAKFWCEPYTRPLVRWGTMLHDRFMLPHFVWEDMKDICDELPHLDAEWFRPHWEFRFPRYGSVAGAGVELELRQAIEPWHVLGEEPGAGGTVRFVDSSVERLQVLVGGLVDTRHVVYCNKRQIPLHPTGRAGEFVAGVRFKAWKPPSSLHPTLDVNVPLTFDLVDTWNGRAVAGCTYHVAHPGGRSYDVYPKNGLEAESRRVARFAPFGHSPGEIPVSTASRTLELPFTLDLRI